MIKSGAAGFMVGYTSELLDLLVEQEPDAAAATSTTVPATTTTGASTTTVPESTTTTVPVGPTPPQVSTTTPSASTTDAGSTTTTTVSTVGLAAGVSLNLQANQIGEVLPDTLSPGAVSLAEHKKVIACTATYASEHSLSKLGDLAAVAGEVRLAAPADWQTTDDVFGEKGLADAYGVTITNVVPFTGKTAGTAIAPPEPDPDESTTTTTAAPTTTSADGSTTTTVAPPVETDADCAATDSVDVGLPADVVVLDDDRNWIRTNGVIPILDANQYPYLSQLIDQVSQQLTTPYLRALIGRVDAGEAPNVAASLFLSSTGLTG
jgi:hypothetical protein